MYLEPEGTALAADPIIAYMNSSQLEKLMKETQRKMETAAKELDFLQAARLRDELKQIETRLESIQN
jgi:excinuclease ABC subunit B